MLQLQLLAALYSTPLGEVTQDSVMKSLKLMGMGMLGIFVVMVLIFLVIAILDKTTRGKNDD